MEQTHTKNKVLIILCITLFGTCITGLALLKPQILTSIIQYEHPQYDNSTVQSRASFYKSFLDGGSAAVSLIALPFFGSLSDVFGRKKIMLIGAGAMVATIITFMISYLFRSLWFLYISCVFSFQMAYQISAIAFMTDIAENEKEKTKNFGYIMSAFMAGVIAGSMGLGYIGDKFGVKTSLFVLLGISVALFCIKLVLFREDTQFYASRKSRKFDIRKSNPFSAVKLVLGTNSFATLMIVVFALNFFASSDTTAMYIYTQHRYNWGSFENGMIGAVVGISTMLWQGLGVGILLRFLSRTSLLIITMLVAVGVHSAQGFAPVGWLFMVAVVAMGFVTIGHPPMMSLLSEQLPKEQQGIAFGGISCFQSLAALLGGLVMENTLAYCLSEKFVTCPGTPFYLGAILYFLNAVICLYIYFKFPQKEITERNDGYEGINITKEDEEEVHEIN